MSRKHIMILGAGVMQLPALRIARSEGWASVVVDGNASATGRDQADFFGHVDLRDTDGLVAWAIAHRSRHRLDGVFTAGTDFSASVAHVAEHLELPGISLRTALDASNKQAMRSLFRRHGVPSPDFFPVDARTDPASVLSRAESMGYPLVVKPVDSMGARGVVRVNQSRDLPASVAEALPFSARGEVLIEQFIEGPEFSIDAVVHRGRIMICGVADRDIRFSPWFIEVGHTMPTRAAAATIKGLVSVFNRAVQAIGIDNGAAKGDIFLGPDGPVIGEIAARLSGGYMSGWTYPFASGVEPTRAAMRIALGLDPGDVSPTLADVSAERAVLSIPGVVESVSGFDAAEKRPNVRAVFCRVTPGDRVTFPRNNVEKCGNIITSAADRQRAIESALVAIRGIDIRLVAGDQATIAHLFDGDDHDSRDFYPSMRNNGFDPVKMIAGDSRLPPTVALETDYCGRTLTETMEALHGHPALELLGCTVAAGPARGRFRRALAKGGLQGGRFFLDTISRVRRFRERILTA